MSYANSGGCQNNFTPEQVRRMRCALSAYRLNVYAVTPMPPAPPPSSSPAPAPLESISMTDCVCQETWTVNDACRNQRGCRASRPNVKTFLAAVKVSNGARFGTWLPHGSGRLGNVRRALATRRLR